MKDFVIVLLRFPRYSSSSSFICT